MENVSPSGCSFEGGILSPHFPCSSVMSQLHLMFPITVLSPHRLRITEPRTVRIKTPETMSRDKSILLVDGFLWVFSPTKEKWIGTVSVLTSS